MATPTRRFYANFAAQQALASSITSSATTCVIVGSFASWPTSFPFYAVLEAGTANAEIVLVTNIVGTTATITRGQDNSAQVPHASGATIDQCFIAKDLDEANAHTHATSGVHGLTGSVVGTTDAQTLTNKTIDSPTLTGAIPVTNITDWNTATEQGQFYHGATTATNGPIDGRAYTGFVYAGAAGTLVQKLFRTTTVNGANEEWQRINTGSGWDAWYQTAGDTGWLTDTSIFTASAGHTVSAALYRKSGHVVSLKLNVTVPIMSPDSTGNILATSLFTITDSDFIPTDGAQILQAFLPQVLVGSLDKFGVFQARLSVPSLQIPAGTTFQIAGTYIV